MVRPCLRWLTDGLEQVAVQQGASPCWAVILFLGFDASLKFHLTDRSEFLLNHDALQLNMKILGNFLKVTLCVSFGMEPNALLLRQIHEI